jgi:Cysteine-rich CPCC
VATGGGRSIEITSRWSPALQNVLFRAARKSPERPISGAILGNADLPGRLLVVPPFENVVQPASDGPYACPCCGFVTLAARGAFIICQVCFWEDDGQDDHDADEVRGGPNRLQSLSQARQNFKRFGASDDGARRFVRKPRPEEMPGT